MKRTAAVLFITVIGLYQAFSLAKQCTSPGKFPNDQVDSCAGYTMCLIAGAGNYAQLNMSCPPGFIYNHILSRCTNVTGYHCQPDYKCTSVGSFPNPYREDCKTYIACIEGLNVIITARSIDCPMNQTFSPDHGQCLNETLNICNLEEVAFESDSFNLAASTENSSYVHSISPIAFLCLSFIYTVGRPLLI